MLDFYFNYLRSASSFLVQRYCLGCNRSFQGYRKSLEEVKEEPAPVKEKPAKPKAPKKKPPVVNKPKAQPKKEPAKKVEKPKAPVKKEAPVREKIPGRYIVKLPDGYYVSNSKRSVYKEDAKIFDDFVLANDLKKKYGGKVVKL